MVLLPQFVSLAVTFASLAASVSAHPHLEPGSVEYVKRAEFQLEARSSLAACQEELAKPGGVYERARQRREEFAKMARRDSRLDTSAPFKRDLAARVDIPASHHSNKTGITNNTSAAVLFDGVNTCVLAPEVTEGPYYVNGEYVRWDVRETQTGVNAYVDVQVIDISTCQPVTDVYVDFWHANATGVYTGIVAQNNGVGTTDPKNINNTALRGIQPTDSEGVAQWLTVVPGHYTGRAPHIHVAAHHNGTVFSNGTFTSSTVSHVGQLFFDQDLITAVEKTSPYSTNKQSLTTNAQDGILQQEAAGIDPYLEYVYLGNSVSDGLVMWAAFGINQSISKSISAAATLTSSGGVANSGSGGGGGGGPGGPP